MDGGWCMNGGRESAVDTGEIGGVVWGGRKKDGGDCVGLNRAG